MVSCCWSHGLVVHVQFWSSPDPLGPPQGDLVKKIKIPIICLRGLIVVLFCKIHDLVVYCASLVQSRCPGAPEGDIVLNSSPPPPPSQLFATKKIVLGKPNAFEGSKMMCEEVFFLLVPFRSKHFDGFWHFLSFKVIMYIYSILWVQQI